MTSTQSGHTARPCRDNHPADDPRRHRCRPPPAALPTFPSPSPAPLPAPPPTPPPRTSAGPPARAVVRRSRTHWEPGRRFMLRRGRSARRDGARPALPRAPAAGPTTYSPGGTPDRRRGRPQRLLHTLVGRPPVPARRRATPPSAVDCQPAPPDLQQPAPGRPAAAVDLVTRRGPDAGRRTAEWLHDRARLDALRAQPARNCSPANSGRAGGRCARRWPTTGCASGCCSPRPRWTAGWTPTCATPLPGRTSACARSNVRRSPTCTAPPARPARSARSPGSAAGTFRRPGGRRGRAAHRRGLGEPGPAQRGGTEPAGRTDHGRPRTPRATCRSTLAPGWERDAGRVRYVRR